MCGTTRGIWVKNFGPIPRDENGFSYEIHHMDGKHSNNDIQNLKMVTIKEHLDIHLKQENWGAAALIGKRMGLGPTYASDIQRGKKRPGAGGRKKGTPNKYKGIRIWTEEQKQKMSDERKGVVHSIRISKNTILEIRSLHEKKVHVDGEETIGKHGKNGITITYERLFAKHFSKIYSMSPTYIYYLITNKEIRKNV